MGRRRLMWMIAGAALLVPLPSAALDEPLEVVEAPTTEGSHAESDQITVPLPGLGEATVSGAVDPDGSAEVGVSADVAQDDLEASLEPDILVGGSADEGLEVDAAAPIAVGPVAGDPVEDVVAPVVDVIDGVAPGVVPDVRPAQPDPAVPIDEGDDVRGAVLPGPGGVQELDGPAPTASVVRRVPRGPSPGPVDPPAASAFDDDASPLVAAPADPAVTDEAAPAVPAPVAVPTLLRVLVAMLVVATWFTNRMVAREVR